MHLCLCNSRYKYVKHCHVSIFSGFQITSVRGYSVSEITENEAADTVDATAELLDAPILRLGLTVASAQALKVK